MFDSSNLVLITCLNIIYNICVCVCVRWQILAPHYSQQKHHSITGYDPECGESLSETGQERTTTCQLPVMAHDSLTRLLMDHDLYSKTHRPRRLDHGLWNVDHDLMTRTTDQARRWRPVECCMGIDLPPEDESNVTRCLCRDKMSKPFQ